LRTAAVVAGQRKMLEAEMIGKCNDVAGHFTFGIAAMPGIAGRCGAVAVTPQVGHYQGKLLRQRRRHAVPDDVSLREAVQQD
jgi:hypothetical protein